MKKMAVLLTSIMLFALFLPASAARMPTKEENPVKTYTVTENGYTFVIAEQMMASKQIVRTYNKTNMNTERIEVASELMSDTKQDEAEAILTALGMDELYLADLPEDTLLESASSEQIIVAVSYIKRDKDGNVTFLSEQEMDNEVTMATERPESENSDRADNDYMVLTHTVYYYGDGTYRFTTYARWKTNPVWRFTDSIGSCAQVIAWVPNSERGHISYTWSYDPTNSGTFVDTDVTEEISDFSHVINGNWLGAAGYFSYPTDLKTEMNESVYSNFRAYFEFSGELIDSSGTDAFNSVACYSYRRYALNISPSISIDFTGQFGVSIGIDVVSEDDRLAVLLLLHPNG